MDWMRLLSIALVLLVVLWSAGATVELLATTLSIGPHVMASAATIAFVTLVLVVLIAAGARNRRWLANPDTYW